MQERMVLLHTKEQHSLSGGKRSSEMAPSVTLARFGFALLLVAVFSPARCEAQNVSSIVENAILCFNNTSIYRNCQEQYRLTASGTLNVPRNAVDAFCSGPCLAETQLILSCIDGILSNFQFYNGATIRAVNATIIIACGSGIGRGNFNTTGNATPPASPPTTSPAPSPGPATPPVPGPSPPPSSHGGNLLTPHIPALGLWAVGASMFMALA